MRVALGGDHAGYDLKEKVKGFLNGLGIEVLDVGTLSTDSVDYPDFAQRSRYRFGMERSTAAFSRVEPVSCSIAAKVRGIRGRRWPLIPEIVRLSRQHNDANVLCLAGRFTKTAKRRNWSKSGSILELRGGGTSAAWKIKSWSGLRPLRHEQKLSKI
jgi:ribose 5-phosphate isomerase B